MMFELTKVDGDRGYMLNYLINDSLSRSIFGMWTSDENVKELKTYLENVNEKI